MTPDSHEIAQQILGKVTEFAGQAMGRVDVVDVGRRLGQRGTKTGHAPTGAEQPADRPARTPPD